MGLSVGLLAVIFSCLTGLIFDLIFPKLVWNSGQEVIKQGKNSLLNLLLAILLSAVIIGGTVMFHLSLWGTFFG